MKAFPLLLFLLIIFFIPGCYKEEFVPLPAITTIAPVSITETTIHMGGIIVYQGKLKIREMGVCWDIEGHPCISDSKVTVIPSSDAGSNFKFNTMVTGLTTKTTYYVRAYATNDAWTAYGECYLICTCK